MDKQQDIIDGWKELYEAVKYDRNRLLAENEELRAKLQTAYDTIENLSKQTFEITEQEINEICN